MHAVVTGGAGFIGSHLVEALLQQKFKVYVIDDLSTGKLSNLHPDAELFTESITSPSIRPLLKAIEPDVVFHLAAQADVTRSIENPVKDGETNILGTINLLQSCVEANVKQFIFASTSAVYGNTTNPLLTEQTATNPTSIYGLSKRVAEQYIEQFATLYGLRYAILRYANVYGPRQLPKGDGGVVAVFLEKLKKQLPITIHGDGKQTRDFIFVKDVVAANLAALNLNESDTFHVSTGTSISINTLLQELSAIHEGPINVQHTAPRTGDIEHSCLANERAKQLIHWQPSYFLKEGLKFSYYDQT